MCITVQIYTDGRFTCRGGWHVQNHLGSDDTTSGILKIISIGAFLVLIIIAVQLR